MDGKFEGWLLDWSGRAKMLDEKELIEMDTARLTPEPMHLIIFDKDEQGKSDKVAIQMGKNGWLTDQDGDKHRCKLLGSKEYIEDKKNITRCDKCNIVFSSKRALNSHDPSKCRKKRRDDDRGAGKAQKEERIERKHCRKEIRWS